MKGEIRVGPVELARPDRAVIPIEGSGAARGLVRGPLWCEYSFPVEQIPPGILVLPAVATLLTPTWTEDLDLVLPEVDADFLQAIEQMKAAWQLPLGTDLVGRGAIHPAAASNNPRHLRPGRSVVLYSGGIDSTATVLRHAHEDLMLCNVWGADDSPLRQGADWHAVRGRVEAFADALGLEAVFVRSNFRDVVNDSELNHRHRHITGEWWKTAQALAYQSLGSAAAVSTGAEVVFTGSSRVPGFEDVPGHSQALEESVRFAGTRVVQDGFGMTRIEKQRLIARDPRRIVVSVCGRAGARRGSNCGRCEKCIRTSLAFAAVGSDPAVHGLDVADGDLARARRNLETGRYRGLRKSILLEYWRELQELAGPDPVDGAAGEFLGWLATQDVSELGERAAARRSRWRGFRNVVARKIPGFLRRPARQAYLAIFKRW